MVHWCIRMTEFKNIKVTEKTHQQLKYLSLITDRKMSNILEDILNNITALSVMYSKGATLRIEHRVRDSTVFLVLHGYSPSFTCGRAFSEAEMKSDIEKHFSKGEKKQ